MSPLQKGHILGAACFSSRDYLGIKKPSKYLKNMSLSWIIGYAVRSVLQILTSSLPVGRQEILTSSNPVRTAKSPFTAKN